jgi:hypothetical protein
MPQIPFSISVYQIDTTLEYKSLNQSNILQYARVVLLAKFHFLREKLGLWDYHMIRLCVRARVCVFLSFCQWATHFIY